MTFSVCDLCDEHGAGIEVAEPIFRDYGGRKSFGGQVVTISCHDDNSLVRDAVTSPGNGKVLVVDGGGSLKRSLLGDQLASSARDSGWQGIIVHGAIRDVDVMGGIDIGVKALNVIPVKTEKHGRGERDVPVRFAGVTFRPGAWVYADLNGVIVSESPLT